MVSETEMAEIKERLRLHGHRCPYCKSTNLTSGMTGHRCLDCGESCLYGGEYMSIAKEQQQYSEEQARL
jgi:ribosomal protein L37AE/L43A